MFFSVFAVAGLSGCGGGGGNSGNSSATFTPNPPPVVTFVPPTPAPPPLTPSPPTVPTPLTTAELVKECFRLDPGNEYIASNRVVPTQYMFGGGPELRTGQSALSTSTIAVETGDFLGNMISVRKTSGLHSFAAAVAQSRFLPADTSQGYYELGPTGLNILGEVLTTTNNGQLDPSLFRYSGFIRRFDVGFNQPDTYTLVSSVGGRITPTNVTQELTLLAIEPLETAAGTIQNSCKFSLRGLPSTATSRITTIWYAPGLGIAKSVAAYPIGSISSVPVHTLTTVIESFTKRAGPALVAPPQPTVQSVLRNCLSLTTGHEYLMQESIQSTAPDGRTSTGSSSPQRIRTITAVQTSFLGVPQVGRRQLRAASAPVGAQAEPDRSTTFYAYGPTHWSQIGSQSDTGTGTFARSSHVLTQGSLLNFDMALGKSITTTWTSSSYSSTSSSLRTATIVATFEAIEPLQTADGVLPETCRIDLKQINPDSRSTTKIWYSQGFGLVQSVQSVDLGAFNPPQIQTTTDRIVKIIRGTP